MTDRRPGAGRPRRDPRAPRTRALTTPAAEVVRRQPVTTRAAMLGLALSAVALLLAVPARTWFAQQAQIASLQRAQTQQSHRINLTREQVTRLADPAAVAEQARLRLGYVKPGERVYVVIEPKAPPAPAGLARATAATPAPGGLAARVDARLPWWQRLWGTAARG